MENKTPIIVILVVYLLLLILLSGAKRYKFNSIVRVKKYNIKTENIINGFGISLPKLIKEKTPDKELNSIIRKHNALVRTFWYSILVSIPIIFWAVG